MFGGSNLFFLRSMGSSFSQILALLITGTLGLPLEADEVSGSCSHTDLSLPKPPSEKGGYDQHLRFPRQLQPSTMTILQEDCDSCDCSPYFFIFL
jgi:hypothetical protein